MEVYSQRESASADEDAYESSRKEAIRADLSRRLRKICSNLSEADFDHLVDLMAENKIRGDRRTTL
jgi:hypothetical protein